MAAFPPLHISVSLVCLVTLACGDCELTGSRVDAFLNRETSQTCTGDADCVVEHLNCVAVEHAHCGQIALNKRTAASSDWKDLKSEAADCAETPCPVCDALRGPSCTDGLCAKPLPLE